MVKNNQSQATLNSFSNSKPSGNAQATFNHKSTTILPSSKRFQENSLDVLSLLNANNELTRDQK